MDNLEWKPGDPGWWYLLRPRLTPGRIDATAWICQLRDGRFYWTFRRTYGFAHGMGKTLEAA
jgi:hypothetical protein